VSRLWQIDDVNACFVYFLMTTISCWLLVPAAKSRLVMTEVPEGFATQ
jgi:hypothetical protein